MQTVQALRAGRMVLEGRVLRPDARKGVLRVGVDDNDLVHFTWAERDAAGEPASEPEIDLVVFPREAAFEKLDRPGARVFVLRFPAEPERNLLFWAQEPHACEDAGHVQLMHSALNAEAVDSMEEDEEGNAESEVMDEVQEAPAAPAAAAAAPPPAPPAALGPGPSPSPSSRVDAAALAAALGSIMGGTPVGAGPRPPAGLGAAAVGPSLAEVLKAERVTPVLSDGRLVQRLAPFLPEAHRSREAMVEALHSPQLKHQLELLSQALQGGQLDTSQFGLGSQVYGVQGFLEAIQRQADEEAAAQGRADEATAAVAGSAGHGARAAPPPGDGSPVHGSNGGNGEQAGGGGDASRGG